MNDTAVMKRIVPAVARIKPIVPVTFVSPLVILEEFHFLVIGPPRYFAFRCRGACIPELFELCHIKRLS